MKTITPKQISNTERNWFIIDAKGKTLGRLATRLAVILKGKHKVAYAPHVDNGDYIIVLNADKIAVTGKKIEDKMYHKHSGFLGGLKSTNLGTMLTKKPTKPLEFAVNGMLPKNKLRKDMLSRLKLVTGTEHKYTAQKPQDLTL